MINRGSQTEPKKKSRRFHIILIATILLLALIIGIVIFGLSNVGQTDYGPGPVDIEVTTDKPFYLQGEEIQFSIYVNNTQNWTVPRPDQIAYRVRVDGHVIYDASVSFERPPGPIPTFPAHSRILHSTYIWNQKTEGDGNLSPVQPGNYTFTVIFGGLVDYVEGGSCIFEIRAKPQP